MTTPLGLIGLQPIKVLDELAFDLMVYGECFSLMTNTKDIYSIERLRRI
jgi:hypothetical protein